ncbi:MAG: hypothetical protein JJT89_11030 [Nitriliruptoraceae bacterium]|nr:hypothetical protein [Nitriliruptoraceae bacterium]
MRDDMRSRMLRGFVTSDPMPTRRAQRIWAVVFGTAMFVFLMLLSFLLAWVAPDPPPALSFAPIAAGIAITTALFAWVRGNDLPHDHE